MRRLLSIVITLCAVLGVSAQDSTNMFRFGYLSYETALQSMPEYTTVQQELTHLKEQYQAETKRVEDEFNRKYEEFLEGQRDFPQIILQKRQTELQELMEKNIAFKEKSLAELAKAEKDMMAPLKIRLIYGTEFLRGDRLRRRAARIMYQDIPAAA